MEYINLINAVGLGRWDSGQEKLACVKKPGTDPDSRWLSVTGSGEVILSCLTSAN